ARVVGEVRYGERLRRFDRIIDRICIGRCYSYDNYEAATWQFRIRVAGPNRIVASNMVVYREFEAGKHIVTAGEAPLYHVCECESQQHGLCLRVLNEGDRTCKAPQLR